MQVNRDSRVSGSTIRAGSQQPRYSEIQIVEEECYPPSRNTIGEDRLLPKLLKNPFDFLQLGEFEQKDPFCQGLRLVLNYKRPNTRCGGLDSERRTELATVKLKIKAEIPSRSFDSIIERSFQLDFLSSSMRYFQNRQIAWLKAGTGYECSPSLEKQSPNSRPAIFFWNNAIVYLNGTNKHYYETQWEDISAVDFHLANVGMVGQRTGSFNLYDLQKQIVYRSISGESVIRTGRIPAVKDLVSYPYDHSNLGFVLYDSVLRGLDFSLKNPACCEYYSQDLGFIPNKAKLLDHTKVAMHGTESNQIIVWDVRNPCEPLQNPCFSTEIDLLDHNPNDSSQIVFSSYRTVYLYSFRTGKVQDSINYPGMVIGLTWHNDGRISVLHSGLFAVLTLLKTNELGKLQQHEEIRTTEHNESTNVFAAEGCKHNTQLLVLGDLDFHCPGYSVPNYAVMRF